MNGIYNKNNQSFSKSAINNKSEMIYRSTNGAGENSELNFSNARSRINASVSRQNR